MIIITVINKTSLLCLRCRIKIHGRLDSCASLSKLHDGIFLPAAQELFCVQQRLDVTDRQSAQQSAELKHAAARYRAKFMKIHYNFQECHTTRQWLQPQEVADWWGGGLHLDEGDVPVKGFT